MRRLLLILVTLSLSWVTIGYACSTSGAVVQIACCCDAGVLQSCPEPVPNCSTDAMLGAPGDSCCSFAAASGISAQGQAENLTTPDLPLLDALPVQLAVERPPSLPVSPHLLARACSTVPIYLLIGRLLR